MAVSDLGKARKIKAEDEAKINEYRKLKARYRNELENYNKVNISLLILTVILISFGLIMLFSSSLSSAYAEWGDPLYFVKRQIFFTSVGGVLVFILLRFPIRFFNRPVFTLGVYGAGTFLLLLVRLVGVQGDYGAMRWVSIMGLQFQPSELAKVAAIFVLATYFPYIEKAQRRGRWKVDDPKKQVLLDGRLYIVYPALAMALWALLIIIQPHFSGALILFLVVISMFFLVKIPGKVWMSGLLQLLPIFLIFVIMLIMVFPLISTDNKSFFTFVGERFAHVFSRLDTFSNPDEASSDSMHQVIQARYALGSGGLTGKGLGMGQQKSGFLPMVYNDFILPSIGEELGFLGSAAIIILFLVYFVLGVRVAINASSKYATLLAWGSTFLITIQALLNIGVAAEIIPPTGISLPFFSYGGSSHIFFMLAVGFLLSVSKSGQKPEPEVEKVLLQTETYKGLLPARRKSSKSASR